MKTSINFKAYGRITATLVVLAILLVMPVLAIVSPSNIWQNFSSANNQVGGVFTHSATFTNDILSNHITTQNGETGLISETFRQIWNATDSISSLNGSYITTNWSWNWKGISYGTYDGLGAYTIILGLCKTNGASCNYYTLQSGTGAGSGCTLQTQTISNFSTIPITIPSNPFIINITATGTGTCADTSSIDAYFNISQVYLSDSLGRFVRNIGNSSYLYSQINSPSDNYFSPSVNTILNCSGYSGSSTIKNISLWTNYSGSWNLDNTNTGTGTSFTTAFTNAYLDGSKFGWTCQVCENAGNCKFANDNRTITIDTSYPSLSLTSPTGMYNYGKNGTQLTLNFTATDTNLQSCWFDYNGVNTSVGCTSGIANGTYFNQSDYTKKSLIFYANDTTNKVSSVNTNWNYLIFENSQSYNPSAYETAIEPFIINYTFDSSIINIESKLNYAGVNYSSTKLIYGNTVIFSANIAMPIITTTSTNPFYWITTAYTNFGSTQSFSNNYTQSLNRIYLAKCNATYTIPTLNFTAYKENDTLQLNPFSIISAFNFWLGNGNTYRTYSLTDSGQSEALCIYPQNRTFYSTATIEYSADGYLARDYYLSNATLTNVTNNISLYLLDTASATSFIEEVLDTGRNPVENAIIYIQRCYGFSCTTVQMAKTDVNGRTIGFYKTETVDYQHIIIKDGLVIYTDSPHKIFGLSVPYTNQFFVGNASVLNFNPNGIPNLYSTLTFDNTTKQVTYLYIDTSGLFQNGRLFVDFFNMSGTNPLICNVTSFSSSASLICDLSTYPEGTYSAVGYITRSIEQVADYITFAINGAGSDMGNYGLFLGMLIIITAGMAFLYHPVAGAWGVTLAMIFTNIVHLTKFTGIWIFGVIFFAILFTWLFKD